MITPSRNLSLERKRAFVPLRILESRCMSVCVDVDVDAEGEGEGEGDGVSIFSE